MDAVRLTMPLESYGPWGYIVMRGPGGRDCRWPWGRRRWRVVRSGGKKQREQRRRGWGTRRRRRQSRRRHDATPTILLTRRLARLASIDIYADVYSCARDATQSARVCRAGAAADQISSQGPQLRVFGHQLPPDPPSPHAGGLLPYARRGRKKQKRTTAAEGGLLSVGENHSTGWGRARAERCEFRISSYRAASAGMGWCWTGVTNRLTRSVPS